MTTLESATGIRPFQVDLPDGELDDLRRRLEATRWPESETVEDESQGVQLVTMQELVRYWATDYDFRRFEARLKRCRSSSPRSTASTSTSFTFGPHMRMRCR